MQLATDATDFASGPLGLVELALSYLNDRQKRYWSKAEIVEYINQSQLDLASDINDLHKDYFLVSATASLVDNEARYSLPPDLVKLMGLEVADTLTDRDPQDLVEVHISDRRFYAGLERAQRKQDYRFFFISGTVLNLRPEPAQAGGRLLRVHYVKRLQRLSLNGDVSEIPEDWHELLAIYAAQRALIKVDRVNHALERLAAKRYDQMRRAIAKLSPQREERIEPFYGAFGPIRLRSQTLP